MTHITAELDGGRHDRLATRATAARYADVADSVGSGVDRELDVDQAEVDFGASPHLTVRSDAERQQLVLHRLQDPRSTVPVTSEFWNDVRRRRPAVHFRCTPLPDPLPNLGR